MSLLPSPRSGHAPTNGLELAYEDYGDANAPAVVMIMGLGTQLLGWPEPLIAELLQRGFRVVRFDNRDVGLSTRLSGAKPTEDIRRAYSKSLIGLPVRAPYRLRDMAQDTLGLLDALQIERAHVVGASMGAMIGQTLAGGHADRVASLTSIMSSSGHRWLRPGDPRATLRLSQPPPATDPETIARHMTETMRIIGSKPHLAMDDAQRYAELKRAAERAYYPAGTARQLLAILASGSRVDLLRRLRAPTLVLHGEHDPLVPVTHGRHTARCIPKARLETFDGMGHDLPPALMPCFADLIAEHAARAVR